MSESDKTNQDLTRLEDLDLFNHDEEAPVFETKVEKNKLPAEALEAIKDSVSNDSLDDELMEGTQTFVFDQGVPELPEELEDFSSLDEQLGEVPDFDQQVVDAPDPSPMMNHTGTFKLSDLQGHQETATDLLIPPPPKPKKANSPKKAEDQFLYDIENAEGVSWEKPDDNQEASPGQANPADDLDFIGLEEKDEDPPLAPEEEINNFDFEQETTALEADQFSTFTEPSPAESKRPSPSPTSPTMSVDLEDLPLEAPQEPTLPKPPLDIITSPYREEKSEAKTTSYVRENWIPDLDQSSTIHTQTPIEGNPPFSVLIEQIEYLQDADEIFEELETLGLITEENKALIKQSLSQGKLLLPRLNEFTAIMVAHRLRRFKLHLKMGLAEEIFPSKNQGEEKPLKYKSLFKQNFSEDQVKQEEVEEDKIALSTTASIHGHEIVKYLEVVSFSETVAKEEMSQRLDQLDLTDHIQLVDIYENLAKKLRPRAHKCGANAVVGINFQLTPVVFNGADGRPQDYYQITCSGTAVLIQ